MQARGSSDDAHRACNGGNDAARCSLYNLRSVEKIEQCQVCFESADESALSQRFSVLYGEIFDAFTDGVACTNALNSNDPFFAYYRKFFLVFLVFASAACIFSMYIRVHATRFFWEHHLYITKHRKGERLSIVRDHMQRVVPIVDEALAKVETPEVLERAQKMLYHHKWSGYAQGAVLVAEDLTMGTLNFMLFTAMVNQPDVLIAVAREDAFRIWWIVAAILLSGMNAVWKWSKVKDLPNVWNRKRLSARRSRGGKKCCGGEGRRRQRDAPEAQVDASSADPKRISISEVARRFARIPDNVGVGMTKAGVKAVFPKIFDYIKSREQTHRIVGLDEDPMDTMTAVSSSYTAESLEEFMYMVRMVDYTDALLAMGIGSTLDDIAATVVSRGLKGKEDFMPRIEGMARSESIQIAAALKKYHNMKIEKNERKLTPSDMKLKNNSINYLNYIFVLRLLLRKCFFLLLKVQ